MEFYCNLYWRRYTWVHDTGEENRYKLFLPWNRLLLNNLEWSISNAVGHQVNVPYWQWNVNRAIPEPFQAEIGGWMKVYRSIFHDGDKLPTSEDIEAIMEKDTLESFTIKLEKLHNTVVEWVGPTMASNDKALMDPVFWLHSSYMDKLWERWRLIYGIKGLFGITEDGPFATASWDVALDQDITVEGYSRNIKDTHIDTQAWVPVTKLYDSTELGYKYSHLDYY